MKPEVKKKWLEALRNNKYKQCTGKLCRVDYLRNEKSFCCLGVLTDLFLKEKKKGWESYRRDSRKTNSDPLKMTEHDFLPQAVQKWAGLERDNPVVRVYGATVTLSYLNDNFSYNFNQIANVVENQL